MSKENGLPRIGISIGDINGVGPEVVLKTLSNPSLMNLCTPIIFASAKFINQYKRLLKDININFNSISNFAEVKNNKINVFNCWQEEVKIEPGTDSPIGGKYAIRSLEVATQCLKEEEIQALVTAPISKSNTYSTNFPYSGHTPYLKDFFGKNDVAMILYTDKLKVSPLTEHIAIKDVPERVQTSSITSKLEILLQSMKEDFGIIKPRIAVLGLNPHNGDNGLYGDEELKIIYPTIENFREKGEIVVGPFASDSFFNRGHYKEFDAILGMYHDQVLVPFKMLDEDKGVNYTAGLGHIRTSPDHGTGFDIAGKNKANPDSFRAALFAAIDLYQQKKDFQHYTENPLQKQKLDSKP